MEGYHPSPLQHLPLQCVYRVRADLKTPPDVPLAVRCCGHYQVGPHWSDISKELQAVKLFWGGGGTGEIVLDGKRRRLAQGDVMIMFPGMAQGVCALEEPWEHYWMVIDGPLALEIVQRLGLGTEVCHAGDPPGTAFDRLAHAICDPTRNGQLWASLIAYEVLTLAAQGVSGSQANPLIDEALHIIHAEWNDPFLNIQSLAQRLNRNRSTLSRLFHQAHGMTLVEYIIRLRIQNALSELKQTDDSIADIACRCGFTDQGYFSRQIRRYTGYSPLKFRKH